MRKKNETIDLSPYRPRQHPLRERFRGKVSCVVLAGYLGVSPARVVQILSGMTGMPAKHEQRLRELADKLDAGLVQV